MYEPSNGFSSYSESIVLSCSAAVDWYMERWCLVLQVKPTTRASADFGVPLQTTEEMRPTTTQIMLPNAAYHHSEILPAKKTVWQLWCRILVPLDVAFAGCKMSAFPVVGQTKEAAKQYMMKASETT